MRGGRNGLLLLRAVSLLWTLFFSLALAQTPQSVKLPTPPTALVLPPLNSSHPALTIDLPSSSVFLTLNVLSLGSNTSIVPTAVISSTTPPSFSLDGRKVFDVESGGRIDSGNTRLRDDDIWKLQWNLGFANWTDADGDGEGGTLLLGLNVLSNGTVAGLGEDNGNVVVQIAVSEDGPPQRLSPSYPLLGDTTANSALIFSPLLASQPHQQPTYPNYTLPRAQLPLAPYPGGQTAQTNLTTLSSALSLIIVPTSSSPTGDGLDNSLMAVRTANASTGNIAARDNMLVDGVTQWMAVGGEEGYRTMWVVGNLLAETNYTTWIVDDSGGLSAPVWFATKEASFPCRMALPNDLCPAVAYTVPFPPNTTTTALPGSDNEISFPLSSFPDDVTELLTASLDSFSTSLLTTACGRDLYSHVSSCADCYAAYRDWLCRSVVPQCATPSADQDPPDPEDINPNDPVADGAIDIAPQTVSRSAGEPRLANVSIAYDYTEMLPCLSNCNRADRACPAFLAFRCPKRGITAAKSYAYLGKEVDEGDGDPTTGPPALNRWGNRWCNG